MSLSRTAFAIAVIATSVLMHLGLLGVIVMAERRKLSKPEIETIAVELVKPEELPQEQKQEPKKEEPKKKDAFKFDMPDQQKASASKQQQQQQEQQKQQQQQQASQQSAQQQQSAAPEKPDSKASQQSAKAPAEQPASSEQPELREDEKPAVPSGGPPSETKAKLTPEEIAAFRAEIQRCWELPVGMPDAAKLEVVLRVAFARKGTLATAPELLKAPAHTSGPRLVGIAMKAMSECAPYKSLPAAKFNEWKVLDLRFLATGLGGLDTRKVDVSKLPRG